MYYSKMIASCLKDTVEPQLSEWSGRFAISLDNEGVHLNEGMLTINLYCFSKSCKTWDVWLIQRAG